MQPFAGRAPELLHELGRDPFGRFEVGRRAPVVEKHHVEVGRVRQLGTAEPPHTDDGEGDFWLERTEGRFDAGLGQRRVLALDLVDRCRAEHVAQRDAQPLPPGEAAQASAPRGAVPPPCERLRRDRDELVAATGRKEGLIGEVENDLGLAQKRVAHDPAGAQDTARSSGRRGRVTEGRGERGRARRPFGQSPELQQAEIRIGRRREPIEHDGEQLVHHPRRTPESVLELVQRASGVFRVDETERAQSFFDRLFRQASNAGERVEERCEEQTLVNRPDGRLVRHHVGVERFERAGVRSVAVSEHACEQRARCRIDGHRVRLRLVAELKPVLDVAEKDVGRRELFGVGVLDVPAADQLLERFQGRPRTNGRVLTSVNELQQLHRELDVADAAGAALDLAFGAAAATSFGLGPRLHLPDLAHDVGVEHFRPHEGLDELDELAPERRVAGDRA